MSTITSLSNADQVGLSELHKVCESKGKVAGWSGAAASFLLIGALIVITCSCLCLALPGVNVLTDVIARGVVPGLCGIILSIPFICIAVKNGVEQGRKHRTLIDTMISHLDTYQIPEKKKKERRANFILHNLLNWKIDEEDKGKLLKNRIWTKEYQTKILTDINKRIGEKKKDRNPRQEKIATAIKEAMMRLNKR